MVTALKRAHRKFLAASLIMLIGLAACTPGTTQPQGGAAPDPGRAVDRGVALDDYAWLYRQQDWLPEDQASAVEVIAVGDILLGRGVHAPEQAFEHSSAWLQSADLALGNLECVLVSQPITPTATLEHSTPPPVRLFASPLAAQWLKEAGFDLLGLANNHALDAGSAGLAESAAHLQVAGLATMGVGTNQSEALQPYYATIKGVRLALLSINAIPVPPETGQGTLPVGQGLDMARWERAAIQEAVQTARAQADIVIVSIHWGYEYQTRIDPAQTRLGEILLEVGADVVIGHHPHVTQAPAIILGEDGRPRLIAYSLGNFVFDQGDGATGKGLALRFFVNQEGLLAVQALPILAGSHPRLQMLSDDTLKTPAPNTATFACGTQSCVPFTSPACALPVGIFESGQADLDADGAYEAIQLEGGRLTIRQDEEVVWTSPESWQVVDAALGDPDHDGRQDLVAIFWKADAAGILRSHPFLIRSQGGRYEEVWGGSAVSEPILEVEVGDVDGDGLDELAILEQAQGNMQSLSIWRWHGWGFSQAWRSTPGEFQNLALIAEDECGRDGQGALLLAVQVR
jgi:poly-gamma-glutamate synthesis protein (capsule biosynthesis protein)